MAKTEEKEQAKSETKEEVKEEKKGQAEEPKETKKWSSDVKKLGDKIVGLTLQMLDQAICVKSHLISMHSFKFLFKNRN